MNKRRNLFKFYFKALIKYPVSFFTVVVINAITFPITLVFLPRISKLFVDRATSNAELPELLTPLILMVSAIAIHAILNRVGNVVTAALLSHTMHDVRMKITNYVQRHSYIFLSNTSAGAIAQRSNTVTRGVKELLFWFSEILFPFFISMGITLVLVFRVSPIFSLLFFSWFILSFLLAYLLKKLPMKYASDYEKSGAEFAASSIDSLKNFVNVKVFNMYKTEDKHLSKRSRELADIQRAIKYSGARVRLYVNLLDITFLIMLCLGLIYYYKNGFLTVGDFIFIFSLYGNFKHAMQRIISRISKIFEQIGTIDNSLNFLLKEHSYSFDGDKTLKVDEGKIEFRGVSLSYGRHAVISELDLTVEPNEKVGIVGLSGAGKSSLIRLLLGFHKFTGNIMIDSQPIQNVSLKSLRDNISYIPQGPTIFNRTLKDNLLCANSKAKNSDLDFAIERAGLKSFVENLPNGYETDLGEKGLKMSGGQKQRLAIARAILKDTKILIMDEATSALDSETEQFIQNSMDKFMKNKTVLVIAHRLSTLTKLDRIVVIDNGKVVESGSHKQLLKDKSSIYGRLWSLQTGDFIQ